MLTYDLAARGELSLYEYLYRRIRADIERGAIPAHDRLPSKRSLAAHLGVSLITVEQAYAQLVAEGYVHARQRSGYFANELPQVPAAAGVPAAPERAPAPERAGAPAPPQPRLLADFTEGAPFSERAFDLWVKALRRVAASEDPAESFARMPAKGSPRLRRAIASHLAGTRGMEVDPACIVVGAGSQVLYGLLVQLLGRDGGFALEDPGYPALTSIYRANGARVAHIPLDGQGMSIPALERSGARVAHVMPSHQYPTGIVTGIARRYELLGWAARDAGRYLVEDDYDCELRLAGRPIPALAGIDASEKVMYLNTFARSISPTLRIAYLALPPHLSARFDAELGFYANTVSAIAQVALAQLIEDGGYERGVNRLRTAHRALRDALADAVREAAPSGGMRLEEADSGLHCVLAVDGPGDEEAIAALALSRGVRIAPLSGYCREPANYRLFRGSAGDAPAARFLLDYAGVDPASMPQAMAAVAAAAREAPRVPAP